MKWTLTLTFSNSYGQSFSRAIDVDHSIAREIQHIEPLKSGIDLMLNPMPFAEACRVLKTKQLRKDLFMQEATRLGGQLAEYLEDKEGWHGESRKKTIALSLSKGGD